MGSTPQWEKKNPIPGTKIPFREPKNPILGTRATMDVSKMIFSESDVCLEFDGGNGFKLRQFPCENWNLLGKAKLNLHISTAKSTHPLQQSMIWKLEKTGDQSCCFHVLAEDFHILFQFPFIPLPHQTSPTQSLLSISLSFTQKHYQYLSIIINNKIYLYFIFDKRYVIAYNNNLRRILRKHNVF